MLLLQTGAVAPLARQAQTYRAAAPERPRRQRVPRIRSPASSRSSYSASESSGPKCWRFPCWPTVPPMRWPTPSDLSNYGTDCVHDRECEDYGQVCYIDLTTHRRPVSYGSHGYGGKRQALSTDCVHNSVGNLQKQRLKPMNARGFSWCQALNGRDRQLFAQFGCQYFRTSRRVRLPCFDSTISAHLSASCAKQSVYYGARSPQHRIGIGRCSASLRRLHRACCAHWAYRVAALRVT